MEHVLEAIYSNGVFKPLETLDIPENQHVTITVSVPPTGEPSTELLAWQQVYSGLSDEEIAEVEKAALERSNFMRPEH